MRHYTISLSLHCALSCFNMAIESKPHLLLSRWTTFWLITAQHIGLPPCNTSNRFYCLCCKAALCLNSSRQQKPSQCLSHAGKTLGELSWNRTTKKTRQERGGSQTSGAVGERNSKTSGSGRRKHQKTVKTTVFTRQKQKAPQPTIVKHC